MGRFLSFQETALALITQFGGPVTVNRADGSLYDPVAQTDAGAGSSEEFMAAVLPPSKQAEYKAQTLEFAIAAEVYFALKGKSFTPGPGDSFTWNGRTYVIRHSQTYDPAAEGPIMTVAYAE